jgi:hypothetical protein
MVVELLIVLGKKGMSKRLKVAGFVAAAATD